MKMAKASEADIQMAMKIANYLDAIDRGVMPDDLAEDDEVHEWIDHDDRAQYARLMDGIRDVLNQGSIFRVIWGMAVLCDPDNRCIDPSSETLELHPDFIKAEQDRDKFLSICKSVVENGIGASDIKAMKEIIVELENAK